MKKPASGTIEEASILLDGYQPLHPGTDDYKQFYINRPKVESKLIREAERAFRAKPKRAFHWFFSGHTGSGKSTELNRIMTNSTLAEKYLPLYIDLESDFNLHNIEYTDIIFAIGKECVRRASEVGCSISEELQNTIKNWGSEIISEEEITTKSEGKTGLKLSLWFLALGEEIKSGGTKRELIRRNISGDILFFIRQIDELAENLSKHEKRRILCVFDGLDHVDAELCYQILYNHYETITRSSISKIIVIPLSILNNRDFLATIEGQYSTIPNIKVFANPGSDVAAEDGFEFYKNVISRYVSLEVLTDNALRSLFNLSAGILRDMIRYTGDACAYASEDGSAIVDIEHVERVWNETMRFYRSQLYVEDYEVLRMVKNDPYPKGIDGVPPLLHNKAIIYYPNGEGWYGVHPAVGRILEKSYEQ